MYWLSSYTTMNSLKRLLAVAALPAVALFLTGCLPVSLHPAYLAKDIVERGALAGAWVAQGSDPDTWTFAPLKAADHHIATGRTVYHLAILDQDGPADFTAVPFYFGGRDWLNLTPQRKTLDDAALGTLYKIALTPGHLVCQWGTNSQGLVLKFMDGEWLGKQIERDPKFVAHVKGDESLVLTGTTRQLQEFLKREKDNTNAFKAVIELHRKP